MKTSKLTMAVNISADSVGFCFKNIQQIASSLLSNGYVHHLLVVECKFTGRPLPHWGLSLGVFSCCSEM